MKIKMQSYPILAYLQIFSSNDSPTAYAIYGNIFYAAPEVLKGEGFFKESDVWSFAVSLWEALTKNYITY